MPKFDEDVIVNGKIRARDGYRPLTDDWEIVRNGEFLEIREPEQLQGKIGKVWARFRDDVCLHLIGTPNLWIEGRIGVGTTTPTAKVEIQTGWSDWIFLRQERDQDGGGGFHIHNPWGNSTQPQGIDDRNSLVIAYRTSAGQSLWGNSFVFHGPTGYVGLGVPHPKERLHVNGNVRVSGDISLENADCAEEFSITENVTADPGTVMVFDHNGFIKPSSFEYDKKVAGVVSGSGKYKPALILNKKDSIGNRVPIALIGKVMCKVDAEFSSIETGDLLTTSPTPGHAMKVIDPIRGFGTVIGKAIGSLETGRDEIPILVTLQ